MNKQNFLKNSAIIISLIPSCGFAKSTNKNHFIMSPKSFEYFILNSLDRLLQSKLI